MGPNAQPIDTPIRISVWSTTYGSLIAQLLDLAAALGIGDDDRELVAAHSADVTRFADLVDQALGDGAQHRVPLRVTERIVDRFEAVEVEEHDRARHIAARCGAQGLAEQLADPAAVGKARQDVDVGEVGQPLLRLADFSDVGPDSAEAFEPSRGIDDRVPGNRDPARAAGGTELHFQSIERLLFEKHPAELGMAAEQRGEGMAEQLAGGLAEQSAHSKAYVGRAIIAIDGPQPADAPLLIFLKEQAGALALASDVGVGLQLVKRPARNRQDTENRHAHREQDREHVRERHRMPAQEKRAADTNGEADHPCRGAGRYHHQTHGTDAEAGHNRRRNHLRARIDRGEEIERQAQPGGGAESNLADQHPHRNAPARSADARNRLVAGKLHRPEIDCANAKNPWNQPFRGNHAPQVRGHHHGCDNIRGGEEGSELGARNQLDVAQGRAFIFGLTIREPGRFPARKPRRNQALITIWSLVHPPAVPPVTSGVDKERLRAVKAVAVMPSL
jgi:hypothetical protein